MLKIFRNHTVFTGALVVLVGVLLRLPSMLNPNAYTVPAAGPLADLLFMQINQLSVSALYYMATAVILIQALVVNYITVRHEVLYKHTYLPALMFVVLNSAFPEQMHLTPQLLANTSVILLMLRICYLYDAPNPLLPMLDAGIYLGIAMLFDYNLLIYLPFIIISVVLFTKFSLRYILVALLGICIPIYFTATIFYLFNQHEVLWDALQKSLNAIVIKQVQYNYEHIPFWLIVSFISTVGAIQLQQNYFRNKVKTRRVLQTFAALFAFSVVGLLIENTNVLYATCYTSIPLSVVTGYYFISDKKSWFRELLFFILVLLSVFYHVVN
ncbi:MAG: DUF6427 family protein [Bacteroidota bacterium]